MHPEIFSRSQSAAGRFSDRLQFSRGVRSESIFATTSIWWPLYDQGMVLSGTQPSCTSPELAQLYEVTSRAAGSGVWGESWKFDAERCQRCVAVACWTRMVRPELLCDPGQARPATAAVDISWCFGQVIAKTVRHSNYCVQRLARFVFVSPVSSNMFRPCPQSFRFFASEGFLITDGQWVPICSCRNTRERPEAFFSSLLSLAVQSF